MTVAPWAVRQSLASALTPAGEASPVLPTLGRWKLAARVGEGQLARVFRARPVGSAAPAPYALKLLRRRWEHDDRVVAMFCREARIARQLAHPRVVPALDAHTSPPYYLVMPYLPGQSLAALLRRGPLELPEALWIARQVAEGLAALHAHGWLHGDVTPSNVLVSPQGQATLIDLGFARPLGERISALDRVVAGTPHYLAPELIFSVQPADARSDLFSLGVILFEMISGGAPAEGATLEAMAQLHREGSLRRLRSVAPQTPQPVATLVEQLLARQPLRRPSGAAEVVEQLFELEVQSFGQRRRA